MENTNFDPWEVADNAKPRDFELYGQIRIDPHFLFFPGNKQKPVPFDPSIHPQDKRVCEVEMHLIPIPEQNINWDENLRILTFSPDWTKIVNPSIKALDVDGLRGLNNRWVRVAKVPGNRERLDKDSGEKTGEFWSTYKFLEVYPDEATCRAAYSGGASFSQDQSDPAPVSNENKTAAFTFVKVFIAKAAAAISDRSEVERQVGEDIARSPLISPYYTIQSPEVQVAIDDALAKYK